MLSTGPVFMWRGMWRGPALSASRRGSCPRNEYSKITFAGKLLLILSATLLALLALIPAAAAQRATPHFAVSRPHAPASNFVSGRNPHSLRSRHSSPYGSLPFPFFGDFFDPNNVDPNDNDVYSAGYPVASEPPAYPGAPFLHSLQGQGQGGDFDPLSVSPKPNANRGPSQPLLIELQNGRYVRVNSPAIDGEALPLKLDSNSAEPSRATRSPSNPAASALRAHESAPAVLVFRDGRSEEVHDYTIAEGILYARGDFYIDGYWNKKIDLSTLDLPQTQRANADRNVKFILPSSPNEVITRF